LLTVEARLAVFRAATTCLAILFLASTRNASCPTKACSAPNSCSAAVDTVSVQENGTSKRISSAFRFHRSQSALASRTIRAGVADRRKEILDRGDGLVWRNAEWPILPGDDERASTRIGARIRGQLRLRAEWRLDGESGQIWEHSIPLVEQRRYSITFRPMKGDIIGR
jgi:hypothetical protein